MSMEPLVSVIMPVYNSKDYLAAAIESVLGQTYRKLELILVNDGSGDGSEQICDRYAQMDERVTVIHKKNGGISDARNHALAAAQGKYVAFCDNDDEMLPQCLQAAVRAAEDSKADIVRFRRRLEVVSDDRPVRTTVPDPFEPQRIELDSWENYILMEKLCLTHGVWAGLFKRGLLQKNHIIFDVKARSSYEDAIFIADCCAYADAVMMIPDVLYVWKMRTWRSTSCVTSEKAFLDRKYAILRWAEEEEKLASRVRHTEEELTARKYEYLYYVLGELEHVDTFSQAKKRGEWKQIKSLLGAEHMGHAARPASMRDSAIAWCVDHDQLRIYYMLRRGYKRIKSIAGG